VVFSDHSSVSQCSVSTIENVTAARLSQQNTHGMAMKYWYGKA